MGAQVIGLLVVLAVLALVAGAGVWRRRRRAAALRHAEDEALRTNPCLRCGGRPPGDAIVWLDEGHTTWACDLRRVSCESACTCYICAHAGPEEKRDYTDQLLIEWAHRDCLARYPAKRRRGRVRG